LGPLFVWGAHDHEKLPTIEKLVDDFIEEETTLETISARVEESLNLALIGRWVVRKEVSRRVRIGRRKIQVHCIKARNT